MRTIGSRFALSRALLMCVLTAACGSGEKSPLGPSGAEDAAAAQAASSATDQREVGVGVSILSERGSAAREVEFKGKVESVGSDRLKVSGVVVLVDEHTEFEDHAALSEITVGETVEVEGTLLPNGTVLAREIERSGDGVEFHGTVKVIDSTRVSVGEVVVVIDTRTRVTVDCNGASSTDIQSEQTVRVTGVLQPDGTVLAVHINVSVNVSVEVTCRTVRPPRHDDDDDDSDSDSDSD